VSQKNEPTLGKLQFCQVWTDFDNFGQTASAHFHKLYYKLSLSLHFYFLYLLLNSSNKNNADDLKQRFIDTGESISQNLLNEAVVNGKAVMCMREHKRTSL